MNPMSHVQTTVLLKDIMTVASVELRAASTAQNQIFFILGMDSNNCLKACSRLLADKEVCTTEEGIA